MDHSHTKWTKSIYNGWMFSLPHFHFQFTSVNIATILTPELKMCVYIWRLVSWLSLGIYISWVESSLHKQICLNCVLFLHRDTAGVKVYWTNCTPDGRKEQCYLQERLYTALYLIMILQALCTHVGFYVKRFNDSSLFCFVLLNIISSVLIPSCILVITMILLYYRLVSNLKVWLVLLPQIKIPKRVYKRILILYTFQKLLHFFTKIINIWCNFLYARWKNYFYHCLGTCCLNSSVRVRVSRLSSSLDQCQFTYWSDLFVYKF